ncbi:Ig-like domain-containing protein, partial [Salinisphaera sp. G21_0]|uniref:Ig-like domain-containing protein n=1 Tax=Salinisphaera sp. G21_0 TaxID=2821094 RepID=UPI001ADB0FF2|nr:hypothetical protein [Salinisphaera sp. G21_0]
MDTIQEATASKSAGSIHFAIGKVEAITPDGNRRVLQAGDVVYPNETVITGADGFIHIDLFDGQVLELSNNDEFSFTAFYQDFLPDDAEIEIEAEQFELPDTPLPATGQPDGQGNSGFGSQTILDLSGIQVDPEAGFDTFEADNLLLVQTTEEQLIDLDSIISNPTIDLRFTSDSGEASSDNLTNAKRPTFDLGQIDSDQSKVEVFNDGTKLGDAVNDGNGNWTFTPGSDLADGDYSLTVKVTDGAGNEASSAPLAVTIDTTISKPVIDLREA